MIRGSVVTVSILLLLKHMKRSNHRVGVRFLEGPESFYRFTPIQVTRQLLPFFTRISVVNFYALSPPEQNFARRAARAVIAHTCLSRTHDDTHTSLDSA